MCAWNNLETNHPELCAELDPEQGYKPSEIHMGSTKKVWWVCGKHDEIFKWFAEVSSRTGANQTGCPKCNNKGHDQQFGGHEHYVKSVRKVHGDKYKYPDPYVHNRQKIGILCEAIDSRGEAHGIFMQLPGQHKLGKGCPKCKGESKLIKRCKDILLQLGYREGSEYICEQTFPDLRNVCLLPVDLYFPQLNLVIEADGAQHFGPVEYWGGEATFKEGRKRDLIKDVYCITQKKHFARIPYTFKPTIEFFTAILTLCKKNDEQLYISYNHLKAEVEKVCDLSKIDYMSLYDP